MFLLSHWHRWHARPRRYRWPAKVLLFGVLVAVVLYPKVWLLPVWMQRLANLHGVVDPDHPWITELATEATRDLEPDAPLTDLFDRVERTVYAHVPYAFDWDTWGVMDFLPTVDEVAVLGREDCDGRAVVAASVLQHLGHDAYLVTDLQHMWVVVHAADEAEAAELMAPGEGEKTLVADEQGTHARLSAALLGNLGRGLVFGIAVFPLGRELIILAGLGLLTLHPRLGFGRAVIGLALLAGALAVLRLAGASTDGLADARWLAAGGGVLGVAGWLTLAIKGAACRSRPMPPE